jgi:hypothetical protein
LCIETSKELRTRLAEVVYEEHADQSLTKQLVTCSMDTAYPPIRNTKQIRIVNFRLELLENSKLYLVFYIILLELARGDTPVVTDIVLRTHT